MNFIEIIGWCGTILVISSWACKNQSLLRIVNIASSIAFIVYGFLLGTPSVVFLNATMGTVNFAHLVLGKKMDAFLHNNAREVAFAFGLFAIVSFGIISAGTNFNYIEMIGTASSLGLVAAFMLSGERGLRALAILSTMLCLIYSALIGSVPMVCSNIISICVNGFRLVQSLRMPTKREKNAEASAQQKTPYREN